MKQLFTVLLLLGLPATQAADITAGKAKAAVCAACHGANGISRQALYPSLAGLPEVQLAEALQQYRDGSRKHALMSPQARGLTDDDIALLAAYYALLPGPSQP